MLTWASSMLAGFCLTKLEKKTRAGFGSGGKQPIKPTTHSAIESEISDQQGTACLSILNIERESLASNRYLPTIDCMYMYFTFDHFLGRNEGTIADTRPSGYFESTYHIAHAFKAKAWPSRQVMSFSNSHLPPPASIHHPPSSALSVPNVASSLLEHGPLQIPSICLSAAGMPAMPTMPAPTHARLLGLVSLATGFATTLQPKSIDCQRQKHHTYDIDPRPRSNSSPRLTL